MRKLIYLTLLGLMFVAAIPKPTIQLDESDAVAFRNAAETFATNMMNGGDYQTEKASFDAVWEDLDGKYNGDFLAEFQRALDSYMCCNPNSDYWRCWSFCWKRYQECEYTTCYEYFITCTRHCAYVYLPH